RFLGHELLNEHRAVADGDALSNPVVRVQGKALQAAGVTTAQLRQMQRAGDLETQRPVLGVVVGKPPSDGWVAVPALTTRAATAAVGQVEHFVAPLQSQHAL